MLSGSHSYPPMIVCSSQRGSFALVVGQAFEGKSIRRAGKLSDGDEIIGAGGISRDFRTQILDRVKTNIIRRLYYSRRENYALAL